MSNEKVVVKTQGFPILGLLGVVFVTLKLLGYITWSWWWVTAPFWAMPVIVISMIAIPLVVIGVVWLVAYVADFFSRR